MRMKQPDEFDDGLDTVHPHELQASYAINGAPAQRTRVHKISSSSLRILTHERLKLRSVISIEITYNTHYRGCLLGQIARMVGQEADLLDFEITIIGDGTFFKALRSNVKSRTVERRPATRVNVNLKAMYMIDGASYETLVHQISASGFRVLSKRELAISGLITFDIMFDMNSRVRLLGQVVRLAGRDGETFDYGLKVIDNAVKNTLRAVVLKLQLQDQSTKRDPLSSRAL